MSAPESSNESVLLAVRDLTLARGANTLFGGLSFSVDCGQLAWVEGPNGSGKSTLLRAICGFLRPKSGDIDVTPGSISYLGHKHGLVGHAAVVGEARFWNAMTDAGAGKRIAQLSAGQQKRIAIARMRAESRPIWLMDEPFAALDHDAAKELDGVVADHLQRGGCAMIVSHSGLRESLPVDTTIRLRRS